MADPNQYTIGASANATAAANLPVSVSCQITVTVVLLIIALFVVTLILYLRNKGCSGDIGSSSSRSHRLIFAPQQPTHLRRALDPSVLSSLPITTFKSKADDNVDGCSECAVCICELDGGEKIRALPKCGHVFHVECIDMWFHSNDTCPLCRSLVCGPEEKEAEAPSVEVVIHPPLPLEAVTEAGAASSSLSAALPSSSSRRRKEGMLVIDVPRRIYAGGFSPPSVGNTPLPTSRVPSSSPLHNSRLLEEVLSPSAFGAFRRMMSRGRAASFKGASCSSMASSCDLEQGTLANSKCQ